MKHQHSKCRPTLSGLLTVCLSFLLPVILSFAVHAAARAETLSKGIPLGTFGSVFTGDFFTVGLPTVVFSALIAAALLVGSLFLLKKLG